MKIKKKKPLFLSKITPIALIAVAFLIANSPASAASLDIEKKRQIYLDADAAIKREDLHTYQYLIKEIKDYPLFPYLDYEYISQRLDGYSVGQIQTIEKKYSDMPFINNIKNGYLNLLARKQAWSDFLLYQPNPPKSEVHQCNYYYAHSQKGDKKIALEGAKKLFLSGDSIHNACDKLFALLKDNKGITDALLLDRMLLAYEKRNKSLLRYLQKQLSPKVQKQGEFILSMYDEPHNVAEFSKKRQITPLYKKLTMLGFKKLAQTSHQKALTAFQHAVEGQALSKQEQQNLADFLASRLMTATKSEQVAWRDKWLTTSEDASLLERRFRVALVANNWDEMDYWWKVLPKSEQQRLKWRYWQARITEQKGNKKEAENIYLSLLGERDFYSVAAAMHLDKPINIPFQTTELDKNQLAKFKPALERVDEFNQLKNIAAAKREWQHVLNHADNLQTAMLAAYANEKDWHHLAVQATISGKLWEHLAFRFPIAHKEWFEFYSKERNLPLTTLLALSRQESAFYTHARSPVGARGLMQIMPATAKETSTKLGLRYLGTDSLKDPVVNIGLGSGYLKMLLDDYDENRILAFAAYNAGPHRVKTWLAKSEGKLDPIAFIEAIPFRETRGYVQNVLMYDIYYRKLMDIPLDLLAPKERGRVY